MSGNDQLRVRASHNEASYREELVVAEIFGPTFQGEGPTSGRRAGFVRLGRCNLNCSWCDTPYTWDWSRFDPTAELKSMEASEVINRVLSQDVGRVVVTGGEPLIQQRRLLAVVKEFRAQGIAVEIETNATIAPIPELVELIESFNASPKLANSGVAFERRIVASALEALRSSGRSNFKFVVESCNDLAEVQSLVDEYGLDPVWIVPQASSSEELTNGLRDLAESVLDRGWNLSSRLHVEVWGDARGR